MAFDKHQRGLRKSIKNVYRYCRSLFYINSILIKKRDQWWIKALIQMINLVGLAQEILIQLKYFLCSLEAVWAEWVVWEDDLLV